MTRTSNYRKSRITVPRVLLILTTHKMFQTNFLREIFKCLIACACARWWKVIIFHSRNRKWHKNCSSCSKHCVTTVFLRRYYGTQKLAFVFCCYTAAGHARRKNVFIDVITIRQHSHSEGFQFINVPSSFSSVFECTQCKMKNCKQPSTWASQTA